MNEVSPMQVFMQHCGITLQRLTESQRQKGLWGLHSAALYTAQSAAVCHIALHLIYVTTIYLFLNIYF